MAISADLFQTVAGMASCRILTASRQVACITARHFTPQRSLHCCIPALAVHAVHVPVMGESITEGTIDVILKKPGDAVQIDDVICTIATDKVRTC